jgi:hypothetical protein
LGNLGKGFPGYLHDTRPTTSAGVPQDAWSDFIIDLARFERAFSEVYDGVGIEGGAMPDTEEPRAVLTGRNRQGRLVPAASLRLLTFQYPVHDYFDAARHGRHPELLAPAETFLAINRRNYVVTVIELSAAQYALLSALLEGRTISQALRRAGASPDQRQHLIASIESWANQGFFAGRQPCTT